MILQVSAVTQSVLGGLALVHTGDKVVFDVHIDHSVDFVT